MVLAFVHLVIEGMIAAKSVLKIDLERIVFKGALVKMVLNVHPRMAVAIALQDGMVFSAIVPATTSLLARTVRTSATALIMPPAIHKMAHAHVRLALSVNSARIVA